MTKSSSFLCVTILCSTFRNYGYANGSVSRFSAFSGELVEHDDHPEAALLALASVRYVDMLVQLAPRFFRFERATAERISSDTLLGGADGRKRIL